MWFDYLYMRCDQYRESASARLDGEAPPVGDAALDAHLAGCAECAGWYAAANRLPELVLAARAEPVPDRSAALLAAALPAGRPRWRAAVPAGAAPHPPGAAQHPDSAGQQVPGAAGGGIRPGELLVRAGIGLLAIAQLLLAVPALSGHDELAHSLHSSHEAGAWNLALAVAVGWISLRPRHAAGLLPLLAAFAAVVTVTSIPDLRTGRVPVDRVSTHAVVWCAAALVAGLMWVRRPDPALTGRTGTAA